MNKLSYESPYKTFIFKDFEFLHETGDLFLRYSLDDKIHFEECLKFDLTGIDLLRVNQELLEKCFESLHLIAGISYYKAYCPAELKLESMVLSKEQADFWNKLYTRGLGEFFYTNKIDFRDLVKFPYTENFKDASISHDFSEKTLLAVGGGKDSIVSAELLKEADHEFDTFRLGESELIAENVAVIDKPLLTVKRDLDEKLFELNKQGALNGHVPITAYLSFLLLTCAVIYDYKYLPLSLEKSSNFGQLDYLGMDVNHQYSKSEEFEQDLRSYVEYFISPDLQIFSLLRPFYEIKIAKLFSEIENYQKYLPVFASCNRNFQINEEAKTLWCGECPKCAFVFSILAAFLPKAEMISVFGKNLYADENLQDLFRSLWGIKANKPFECVGTAEEVNLAFYLANERGEYADDLIMKNFCAEVLPNIQNIDALKEKLLGINQSEMLPEKFRGIVNRS